MTIDEILTGYTAGRYSATVAKALISQVHAAPHAGALQRAALAVAAMRGQMTAGSR
jgi:hypothetical protein